MACALCLVGEDDHLGFFNTRFARLFATTPDDVRDGRVTDFVPAGLWRRVCDQADRADIIGECTRRDGRTISVELTVRSVSIEETRWWLLTVHEAGTHHPGELAPTKDHHLEGLATLAGGIAHEFNTVLTIVQGYSELIREYAGDPSRLQHTVDTLLGAARRGADVVYQLQLFARTEECPRTRHDLHQLVRDSVAHTARNWPQSITIELDLPALPTVLMLNAAQIILALQHLIQNAREALPHDTGRITLRTRLRHDLSPSLLCLTVEDTGIGMDEATRSRVVEPFFTRHRAGMRGLGLTVVHGIIRAHGGRIDVDSVPNDGTRIHLWFPFPPPDPFENILPLSFDEAERERSAIDVVRDHPGNIAP